MIELQKGIEHGTLPVGQWLEHVNNLLTEETLRRFEALNPEPARGPRKGQHIFIPVTQNSETAPDSSEA